MSALDTTETADIPEVAVILDRAADLLVTHGWIQNHSLDEPSGAICANTAIAYAVPSGAPTSLLCSAQRRFADHLEATGQIEVDPECPDEGRVIARWNDRPAMTAEQVIAALRAAAAGAR